ncbi:Trans-thyretin-related family domain family member [Aphelenchoides fujianensis]|nr:Trans-thyretin-related family domain family member [Aphelenchoides fujianensis]
MIAKVLFVLLAVGVWAADDKNYLDSIATRSTKIEGHLRCGSAPVTDAHVRLYRIASEDLNDVIASGKTDGQGRFSVEGDTGRFQGDNSAIDPVLRIYPQCCDGKCPGSNASGS